MMLTVGVHEVEQYSNLELWQSVQPALSVRAL